MSKSELLASLSEAVSNGRKEEVQELVKEALKREIDALEVVDRGLIPGVREVGDRFSLGEAYLPEMIMSADAMMVGLQIADQVILAQGKQRQFAGRVLIGTVQGDIHTIGKDILISVYRANGFAAEDLGVDVPTRVFVDRVRELKPDILGLSALMNTTLLVQREVIEALGVAGVREKVRVLVGGAPVTPAWAQEIGADGTAPDAVSAVQLSKRLLEVRGVDQ